jgi:ATP/maltotriose-dependent transcriptional regulator MalT
MTSPQVLPTHPWLSQALAELAVDDLGAAESSVVLGRQEAERARLVDGVALARQLACQVKMYAGNLEGALTESESALNDPVDNGNVQTGPAAVAHTVIATVRIYRGDLVDARNHVLAAAALASHVEDRWVQAYVRLAHAQLWAAEGRPTDAVALLDGLYRDPRQWAVLILTDPTLVPTLSRLAKSAGVSDRARRLISLTEDLVASNRASPSLAGAALQARGLVNDDAGRLVEAVSLFQRGPRRLATAIVQEDAAQALDRRGDTITATQLYRSALDGYTGSGASHARRRVQSLLRNGGDNRNPRQRRGRPKHGWASLTESELQVVRLVAEGLTNRMVGERLFMSRYTVDSHLRHVFSKLAVGSRVALTRLVIDQLSVTSWPVAGRCPLRIG